jgi:DNA polymerase III delta subunit
MYTPGVYWVHTPGVEHITSMKIIVLHGDDYTKSSIRLKTFKDVAGKRGWEYQQISDITTNIAEVLFGQSLFVKDKLVVIDEPKLINASIAKWINNNYKKHETTLVIYSDKKLSAPFLKTLPKDIKVEEAKLPTKLWTFLDSFYPGNSTSCIKLLHEVVEKYPIEMVFSLLAKQTRDIYWVLIDEKSFPQKGWRASKLKVIGNKFGTKKVEDIIKELAEIDVKSKTSDVNLLNLLDFVIIRTL